ncbi:hypothetical protein ABIA35_003398 [Catenulispora sp. MAP12-49]|uniref:hypothetical protein n=1 Tax=unclassified Catenulispora TaxID=414885 RepID=UPI003517DC2D
MSTTIDRGAPPLRDHPEHNHDAYRDVLLAVQRALAPYSSLAPFTNIVFLRRGAP